MWYNIYTYLHLQIIICIWYIHALYPLHHSSITQQWWSWPRDPAGPWRVEAMRTSCRTRESGKPRADSVEHNWLVVWNINFIFPYIGNVIIPTDFHIFQRGGSTTNQIMFPLIKSCEWYPACPSCPGTREAKRCWTNGRSVKMVGSWICFLFSWPSMG